MRLKKEFQLCNIGGQAFLIPMGEAVINVKAMLDLNEVGEFIVKLIENQDYTEEQIVDEIHNEYECDLDTIRTDLKLFIKKSEDLGILEGIN